jgi:Uma2 family endonuclease
MAVLEKEIPRGPARSALPNPELDTDNAPRDVADVVEESPRLRPFTREEFYRLGEEGIFRPDERVELIEGVIYTMPPPGPEHCADVSDLSQVLRAVFGVEYMVREEKPVTLPTGEPLPDIAVVVSSPEYRKRQPGAADIRLIVEVAASSQKFDRATKVALYAKSGIADYWIVNLRERRIEVYREPDGATYKSVQVFGPGESVEPLAAPGKAVNVSEVLPPAEA